MKMLRNIVLAAAALALVASGLPANAATQMLCAPTLGSKRVTNQAGTTAYVLNGRGCASIAAADVGFFASQGYTPIDNAVIANQLLAAGSVILPAGAYIEGIIVQETSGGAVTGGLDIGTTSGATDVVNALTCAASCLTYVLDSALSKRVFSSTTPQRLFIQAKTNFTSGPAINVTIRYSYF